MNKRLLGAAAVVILAVGMYLGNLFRGFGLGGGPGEGENGGGEREPQVNVTAPSATSTTTPSEVAATDSPDVLTVLVEAAQYQIQQGTDENAKFEPAELTEVVARSRDTAGDEHGVRIRLRFRRNAQTGAINDLYQALQSQAGVQREEIIEATGYVD
jgi:hypothetical protein